MNIRQLVLQIRQAHGMSNADLAKFCGVSIRTVEGWLQNRNPSGSVLTLLKMLNETVKEEGKGFL